MIVALSKAGWSDFTVGIARLPGDLKPTGGIILGVYEVGEIPCDGMQWVGPKTDPLDRANAYLRTIVQQVIVGPDPREIAENNEVTNGKTA